MPSWQAELRASSFLGPFYPGSPGCAAFHQRFVDSAQQRGELLNYRARAFVGIWRVPEQETTHCIVHRGWQDEGALAWAKSVLRDRIPEQDEGLEITLPVRDEALRQTLMDLGLGLTAVNLAGRVPLAYQRLMAAYPPQPISGFTLRDLVPSDVDAVLAMRERVFGAEPAYNVRANTADTQARVRATILRDDWVGLRQVVEVQGQLRGLIESFRRPQCPHHISSSSTGLMLDTELRGLGIAKQAYRLILENLMAHDIAWIKGTTGRPSVMHLGQVMGRGPTGVILRKSHTLPTQWFHDTLHPPSESGI